MAELNLKSLPEVYEPHEGTDIVEKGNEQQEEVLKWGNVLPGVLENAQFRVSHSIRI